MTRALPLLALLAAGPAQAGRGIEIRVDDRSVIAVELICRGETTRVAVHDGLATFPARLGACKVQMVRPAGTVDGPGRWTCDDQGCHLEELHHKSVVDAPDRVNVIFTHEVPPAAFVELTCPGGFRVRSPVDQLVATFTGVADTADCALSFYMGAPLRFDGVRPGTWRCTLEGSLALCER